MTLMVTGATEKQHRVSKLGAHPTLDLVSRRVLIGCVTLVVVSILVFFATQVLPGNAAYAVLGR